MNITWVPIDQCPEEWRDGRQILAIDVKSRTHTAFVSWYTEWGNWIEMTRNYSNTYNPTHVAEIPPGLRPENIGLGKRVSVKMMGNSRWVLDSNDHTATIIKMERDYSVSKYVCAHPCSNEILWKELGTYPTLQAAIDAFEETLL